MENQLLTTVPAEKVPYLLRDSEGPRYLFGTQLAAIIASAQSTGNLFELVLLSGGRGDRFPAHQHSRSHEAIYVLDGLVEVRLNDQTHLLATGDYAHIPAGTIHAYAMQSHHTRLLSFSMNDGVAGLYARLGEATLLFVHPPQGNGIDLSERLQQVVDDLDISLVDDTPDSQPAQLVTNTELPAGVVPYVIAAGGGNHRSFGDQVYTLLAMQANTNGEFIVSIAEGPKGAPIVTHFHERHTETFLGVAGNVTMWANGEEVQLAPGDFLHVPPHTRHAFRLDAHYTKFFSVLAPGLFEPFFLLGDAYAPHIFPSTPLPPPFGRLMQNMDKLDLKFAGPPPGPPPAGG